MGEQTQEGAKLPMGLHAMEGTATPSEFAHTVGSGDYGKSNLNDKTSPYAKDTTLGNFFMSSSVPPIQK